MDELSTPAPEHPLRASTVARCLRRLFPRAVFEIEAAAVSEAATLRRHSNAIPGLGETLLRERFGLC